MAALTDYDLDMLRGQFERWGFKPSHADRLLQTFYRQAGRIRLEDLVLGRQLTERIREEITLRQSQVALRSVGLEGTVKLLISFSQGQAIESVLMPTRQTRRAAGCLSSQIGCAMGCDFCASTRNGLARNLEAGEMVEQFLWLKEEAEASGRLLHTLVFMGMGEPLLNLDNVLRAVDRIANVKMGELGWRQITLSTVGIVPGIEQLADREPRVNLALSLHAADDAVRSRLIPANRRYPVADIIAATKRFYRISGHVTNIAYCLMDGVNDSDEQAKQLAELLRDFKTHVNLIPYNAIGAGLSGTVYRSPPFERTKAFLGILRGAGIVAHLRSPRGSDVNAACGQLAGIAAN
jgi:23S rRNA (adenine2503-C2)-methyltransferase